MAAGMISSGQLIAGRYRLAHEIGRGGMATVYRAHDEQLGRDVALKLLDAAAADDHFSASFLAEARAVAALPNPHVVTVFDAGQHEGRPFIVMELVEGGDLRARLRREGRLEPREAARVALGVARGLAATHARGLVHCDVKPLNVLLTPAGEPKLVDFGIARAASRTGTLNPSEIVGSAPYLSPEQVRGGRIDPRTDVYALGILLYELLTGRPPFSGNSLAEVAAQRLHRPPRPIREVAPATPAALAAVVDRALRLDPNYRFSDAAAMASALEVALEELTDDPPAAGRGLHDQTTRAVPRAGARAMAPARRRPSRSPIFPAGVAGRKVALPLAILALALAGLVGIRGLSSGAATERIEVPAVAGLTYDEAARRLEETGLTVSKDEQVTQDTPRGIVVTQEPREGGRVPKGGTVRLLVSRGVEVPSLVGKHWDEVKPWMDQHGWRVGRLRFVFADRKDFGKVLAQEPTAEAGPAAEKAGTPLNITVAGPPEATRTGFQTAPAPPSQAGPPSGRGQPDAANPESRSEAPKPGRDDGDD